jgi:hypothetical protein
MRSVSHTTIQDDGLHLDAQDIAWGFRHRIVSGRTVIDLAVEAVMRGDDDPQLVELSCLLGSEADQVNAILGWPAESKELGDDLAGKSWRKWLYLLLLTAYSDHGDDPDTALGLAADLYCDFGHPDFMSPIVRWMPAPPGEQSSVRAIMDRWATLLRVERAALP